jgi:hypothetical protein
MFEKIKSIKKIKKDLTYDVEMYNKGFQNEKVESKSNFVVDNIICKNSGGDARTDFTLADTFAEFEQAKEFQKKYPKIVKIAQAIEGCIRHQSLHAAAMVVAEKPLCEYVPTHRVGGEVVMAWEKKEIENFGLIKYDILGLKTLTIISDTLKMIEKNTGQKVSLPVDFEDPKVYDTVFKTGKTSAIFQFECLSGDTKIGCQGNVRKIRDMYNSGARHTQSYDGNALFKNKILAIQKTGVKEYIIIRTKSGRKIKCSLEHPIRTKNGFIEAKNLVVGDKVLVAKFVHSNSVKESMSEIKKRQHSDSNTKYNSQEFKEKRSCIMKEKWQDSAFAKRMAKIFSSPELREKQRQARIRQGLTWEEMYGKEKAERLRELKRKHFLENNPQRCMSPEKKKEFLLKRNRIQSSLWKDAKYKLKQSKAIREAIANSKCFRKKISESNHKRLGELHPNWRGGKSFRFESSNLENMFKESFLKARKMSLKRDNYRCINCHIGMRESCDKFGFVLHTHHIRPVREFIAKGNYNMEHINAVDNLQTLCVSCHIKEERACQ